MKKMTTTFGVLAAGLLLLGACGDDEDGAGSNEYSDALAASFEEEDSPFDADERDCLARQFVDAIGGPEAFEDAGLSPEEVADADDLSEAGLDVGQDEADALAGSFSECDISLSEAFLAELDADVPDDVRTCVEDSLDDEELADAFAQTIVAGDSAGDDLPSGVMEDLAACLEP